MTGQLKAPHKRRPNLTPNPGARVRGETYQFEPWQIEVAVRVRAKQLKEQEATMKESK